MKKEWKPRFVIMFDALKEDTSEDAAYRRYVSKLQESDNIRLSDNTTSW